jgi:hypothetical protein
MFLQIEIYGSSLGFSEKFNAIKFQTMKLQIK